MVEKISPHRSAPRETQNTRPSRSTPPPPATAVLDRHVSLTHVLEHEVDVAIAVGANDVQKADDVRVVAELLQEQNLSERALSIGRVPERVEYLFQRHHVAGTSVDCLPNDAVRL